MAGALAAGFVENWERLSCLSRGMTMASASASVRSGNHKIFVLPKISLRIRWWEDKAVLRFALS
jgi:hypothetical protein